jgi:hypothetical protein
MGQQRLASQSRIDADVGVLSIRPHAQYLHPHQRLVEEDESPLNDTNITTPFDYSYYYLCTYLNCTCSNVDWAEQTMEAVCEEPRDLCSNALFVCAAENGNPTNSCIYELKRTVKITGPAAFEENKCIVRSMPYYEKTCWYYAVENVTYEYGGWLEYDVKECTMAFNGDICNSCKDVPTSFEYCDPDGTCINGTTHCNEFDCTNIAEGESFFKCIIQIDS